FRSSIIVSAATMLSRVLGLVRDIVFAVLFGSGGAQDAFFVAFKIPNFLRRLFAEGAFNQAFVPVLSEYRHAEGDASVRKLVSAVQIYLGAIVGVVTLLAVVGSPIVAWLFASGFHDDGVKLDQVAGFLRITFPYLWFISLTALGSSVLNSYQQFAAPALAPVILNLCLIGSALFLSPLFEVGQTGIAWGVFLAGLLQWLFLWPWLLKTGVWTLSDWRAKHPGVKKILVLMVPGLFAVSVSQINLLLDTLLATWLADGSVGWLYYSDRLTELPLGVIGVAIGTVLLPRLSSLHAESDGSMFERTLAWAIRLVLLIGLPAMVALLVMPDVLLSLLFGHGEFTAQDVQAASGSLAAYAIGLPAFMLIKILAPGFFSRQDTKTPVKIAVQAMVWNMVFNVLLIVPLAHVGLALATSLSAWLNASLLAWHLRKDNRLPPLHTLLPSVLRIALASTVMGVVLWAMLTLTFFSSATGIVMESLSVAMLVVIGLVVFGLTALVLGIRPAQLRHP
ncbi:murein biosynthesis integral membrane protein MurJ, partial [Reinekea blandensis]